ncbi:unnamed protein product [Psylliodes chrysocephalus]|uniref:Uncharacterized protein n=1 Tax=Psylliodes chrysocephalus TaxID=3402493 RepID=A0A9P0G9G8_9CUCU|nr:unnamed protein product [Psylliodes chrysocephala]
MNISGSRIRQIIHQFSEPGHSFLPCDRCFGLIEKEKRKKEIVYLPYDWINLVKKTSKKFRVIEVKQDMILNFTGTHKTPTVLKKQKTDSIETETLKEIRVKPTSRKNKLTAYITSGVSTSPENENGQIITGSYVIVRYQKKYFPEIVVNRVKDEYEVKCMTPVGSNLFK